MDNIYLVPSSNRKDPKNNKLLKATISLKEKCIFDTSPAAYKDCWIICFGGS